MNITAARAASQFAGILPSTGAAHKVLVPGHGGKHYFVLMRKERIADRAMYTGECLLDTNGATALHCPSYVNRDGPPCYHMLAALIAVARSEGCRVALCTTEAHAKKLCNLLPDAVKFEYGRRGGSVTVWVVTWKG